jgi:uncharacterized membrane protein
MGLDGNIRLLESTKCSLRQNIAQHPLLFFSIVHIIIILGIFTILNYRVYSDPGGLERWFALCILEGNQLPYRDFISEYPPVTILSFILPAFLFREPLSYGLAFAAEMCLANLIILMFLTKISDRLTIPIWKTLSVYTIFIISAGTLSTTRHDMLPAMLVIITLYAFITGKKKTTWAILGLGVMTKIYPVILAPIIGLYYLRNKQYSDLINGINALVVVITAISVPWLLIDADGFVYFITYHAERGLQIESTYATILLFGQMLGLTSVDGVNNFGSWNLTSPLADSLANISPYLTAGLLIALYLVFFYHIYSRQDLQFVSKAPDNMMANLTIQISLLSILILLLTDKIFSPQYLIWLCPLIPLITSRRCYSAWCIFFIVGIFTQYIFPHHYIQFAAGEAIPVVIAASRNLLLLVLVIVIAFPNYHTRNGMQK